MSPAAALFADELVADELGAEDERGELVGDDDELLVEEISIDGMCGVY